MATNVPENQLLAFDAEPHGVFTFGDGKAGKYFATGFTKAEEFLAWPIRLNAPATFDISVHCGGAGGTKLVVQVGDQAMNAEIPASNAGGKKGSGAKGEAVGNQIVHFGPLKLPVGEQKLRFKLEQPSEVSLFEVLLKPVK